jgi:succinate dehydrogenase / fumarate reductase iron-sulfur subunit
MEFTIDIRRMEKSGAGAYTQSFLVENDGTASVAAALESLNGRATLTDAGGAPAARVGWECSCLQRKCGACAMRINGTPRLACSAFLREFPKRTVMLEPLGKFPVVSDLIVDRSEMFKGLEQAKLWLEEKAFLSASRHGASYQSARCLMCGCCLEVCPNFISGEDFSGAALSVNAFRILEQTHSDEHRKNVAARYGKQYFNSCGHSLACHEICPVGLPVEELLVRSNAAAVWGRYSRSTF